MPWELTGNPNTNEGTNFLGTTDGHSVAIRTNNKEALRVDRAGNIGIGTPDPTSKLEIVAQDALLVVGYQPFLTLSDSNSGYKRARIQNANGDINFFTEPSFSSGIPPFKIQNSGTVQIAGQDALLLVGYQPFLTLSDSNSGYKRARIENANGDINFFTEASFSSGIPPMTIHNNSEIRVTRDLICEQDVKLTGADCAEDFDIGDLEDTEPGTVMVLREDGSLEPSRYAYDKKVAGVVSGAGEYRCGIVLDKRQSSSKRLPIALIGKVYCKVDAQYSSIEVGDLLTTSPIPGHAMKASDPLKAFGAVIGKALRPLHEGQELIPILVTLQ